MTTATTTTHRGLTETDTTHYLTTKYHHLTASLSLGTVKKRLPNLLTYVPNTGIQDQNHELAYLNVCISKI